jgi:PPP family 3-phenylpropionic acid transporter
MHLYSFYSNFLKSLNFSTTEIGFLWAMGVVSEIVMFAYATTFFKYFLGVAAVCLILTSIRWLLVAIFSHYFIGQLFAQPTRL